LAVTGCKTTDAEVKTDRPTARDTEERVETIELQQNQPGWVGEERVVVFNFRERPYTDAAGAERTGLTAIISHVATADEQIAGAGARVTLAGTLYQVATIEQAESGAGRVVLEPIP